MASAAVNLGGSDVYEFEVDGSQQIATLKSKGGYLRCNHATEKAYINVNEGTCSITQPVGAGGMCIFPGKSVKLPKQCGSFTFKAGASTFLQYSSEPFQD